MKKILLQVIRYRDKKTRAKQWLCCKKEFINTGYQGIQKLHQKSALPKKKTKQNPVTTEDKRNNRVLSRERVLRVIVESGVWAK